MAKLYWRIKRNGKWTWVAATPGNTKLFDGAGTIEYIGPEECLGGYLPDHVPKPEVYTDE